MFYTFIVMPLVVRFYTMSRNGQPDLGAHKCIRSWVLLYVFTQHNPSSAAVEWMVRERQKWRPQRTGQLSHLAFPLNSTEWNPSISGVRMLKIRRINRGLQGRKQQREGEDAVFPGVPPWPSQCYRKGGTKAVYSAEKWIPEWGKIKSAGGLEGDGACRMMLTT